MAIILSKKSKGILSLFGSCFFFLALGSNYILGNINIYVHSYYTTIGSDQASIVFPVSSLASNIAMLLSLPLCNFLGFRPTLILSTVLILVSLLASSYCENFWLFFVFFGIGFGGCAGFLYLNIMLNLYKYFPKDRGLVGGIVQGFNGLSPLIANYIVLAIINPDDVQAEKNPNNNEAYFPLSIANRLPGAIRVLVFYFLGVMILGYLLIFEFKEEKIVLYEKSEEDPQNKFEITDKTIGEKYKNIDENNINNPPDIENITQDDINNADEKNCESLSDALHDKAFYFIIIMVYCSAINGYFMASNFKNYGISKIPDDEFLTLVGSLSALCNGGGRFIWGFLSDRFKFRRVFLIILIIQLIDIATLRFVSDYKVAYLFWVCFALLCEGSIFVIFPPLCLRVFGQNVGGKIYSILLFATGLSNLTQYLINLKLRPLLGFENEFYIYLAFTSISFLICIILKQIHYKKLIIRFSVMDPIKFG